MDNKIQLVGKDGNGKDIDVTVLKPTQRMLLEAQKVCNIEMSRLIRMATVDDERLLLRSELAEHMKTIGVWTTADATNFLTLQVQIRDAELKLRHGGIKVSEGKEIALQMVVLRRQLWALYAKRSQFDDITIEANAENHKFNFLISKCVVDTKLQLSIFEDIDDYIDKAHWSVSIKAAEILASMMHGLEIDAVHQVPEQIWLRQFKLMNDDGDLVNAKGQRIDADNKLIDEHGRFINEDGKLIDTDGNIVDDQGRYAFKTQPFLDDETGEPIVLDEKKAQQ